jgi:hypothetical protein
MNSKKLSEWLGITANLGVILGIAILAFEINQSTKATAAAVSDSVMTGYLELSIPIIADPQVARVMALGLYQPESLSDEEAVQFAMWFRQLVNQHIRISELTRQEMFSEFLEGGDIQQLARLLSTPGGQLFLEGNRDVMPQELLNDLGPYLGQQLKSDFTLGRNWRKK